MIINTDDVKHIYVANHHVDMRKSIDGLSLIVNCEFEMNLLDHSLFIFTNKARNRIKILYYENGGFWLFIKRMERGTFKIEEREGNCVTDISSTQLNWLLEGLEFNDNFSQKRVII